MGEDLGQMVLFCPEYNRLGRFVHQEVSLIELK